MKRRNEEAECTTEPNRFAPNPPKNRLHSKGASMYAYMRPVVWTAQDEGTHVCDPYKNRPSPVA